MFLNLNKPLTTYLSIDVSSSPANIVDWLTDNGIEPSKRQAREDVANGAMWINGERVTDLDALVEPSANFDGKYIVVRKGKKKYFLAKVI